MEMCSQDVECLLSILQNIFRTVKDFLLWFIWNRVLTQDFLWNVVESVSSASDSLSSVRTSVPTRQPVVSCKSASKFSYFCQTQRNKCYAHRETSCDGSCIAQSCGVTPSNDFGWVVCSGAEAKMTTNRPAYERTISSMPRSYWRNSKVQEITCFLFLNFYGKQQDNSAKNTGEKKRKRGRLQVALTYLVGTLYWEGTPIKLFISFPSNLTCSAMTIGSAAVSGERRYQKEEPTCARTQSDGEVHERGYYMMSTRKGYRFFCGKPTWSPPSIMCCDAKVHYMG